MGFVLEVAFFGGYRGFSAPPPLYQNLAAREADARGVLTHGGPGGVYALGHRLARRLARATGNDVEDVLVAVAERYGDMRNA